MRIPPNSWPILKRLSFDRLKSLLFDNGQVSAKVALDRTAADWKRIINDLGKAESLRLYQESIGYK